MNSDFFLSQEEINRLLAEAGGLSQEEREFVLELEKTILKRASQTLSMILGKDVRLSVKEFSEEKMKELKNSLEGEMIVTVSKLSGGLSGSTAFLIDRRTMLVFADLMMGGTGEVGNDALDEVKLSALTELMNQVLGTVSSVLSETLRMNIAVFPPELRMVNFSVQGVEVPFFSDEQDVVAFKLELEADGLESKPIHLYDAEVLKRIAGQRTGKEREVIEEKKTKVAPAEFPDLKPTVTSELPSVPMEKLELLLDIPLKVTVELGRTRMTLKQVLEMVPGSIVELDKLTGEPVDILVNGKLVARGEVVVIDENFGVRITEIVSPKERLQLLKEQ